MRILTLLLLTAYCSLPLMAQDTADSQDTQTSAGQNPQDPGQQPGSAGPAAGPTAGQTHPTATTYSNGYEVRLKIHKYSSWATIPLFATEFALGQSLYNQPETGAKRTAHGIVGTGIVGLFGLNTFTGGWNLWEGRHDPDGRTLRIVHSVLMIAGDAGFLAATATGPHMRNGIITNPSDKSLHRDIAVASIGVSTVSYLIMLFKGR